MKNYVFLSVLLLIGSNIFGQSEKNRQKESGDKESTNTRYSEGASGVKRSISYRFVAGKHSAGTGNGTFCFDADNVNSLNYVLADDLDLSGEDQTKWYSTWDDTTGATGRGRITLVEYEGDNTIILDVKDVLVNGPGFWKIPVEYISGKMPAAGKVYYYIFSRIAHGKIKPVVTENNTVSVTQESITETVVVAQPQTDQSVQQSLPVSDKETPAIQTPSANGQQTAEVINVKEDRRRPAGRSDLPLQSTEDRLRQVSTVRQPVKEPDNEAVAATSTKTTASTASTPQVTQPKGTITSRPIGNQVSDASTAPPSYQSNLPEYRSVANQYSQGRGHGKCYSGIIEVGYGMGVGDYGINNFRFNFINGFHIGPTFTMGLGIGWRRYFPDASSDKYLVAGKSHMPVFLDLRKRFSTKTVTPYLALGIGSSAVFVNDGDTTRTDYEGLLLNPSGGIWFNISSRFAVFAGISYELQKLEFAMRSDDRRFKGNAASVSFNIGISF